MTETLRCAAAHMRGHHGPEHPRHLMWQAMADLLDTIAAKQEAAERVSSRLPVANLDEALTVARAYLRAAA